MAVCFAQGLLLARKNGWLRLMIWVTKISEIGSTKMAASVISGLIVSIITSTPMTVVTLVTICDRLWFMLWLSVSMSLVTRESTSPVLVPSKYRSGNRLIFR